jgi:hypothetical protein
MLELDLSMFIGIGTLVVTFINVFQVHKLKIEFYKKSKVYDKKFEVISHLEELLVLCKIDITSIINYYSFTDEKPQKMIEEYGKNSVGFMKIAEINKKLLNGIKTETLLYKIHATCIMDVIFYSEKNNKILTKKDFIKELDKSFKEISILTDELLEKYHSMK